MLQTALDYSPLAFGQADDPVRILVSPVDSLASIEQHLSDLALQVHTPPTPRAQRHIASVLVIWPYAADLASLRNVCTQLREGNVWPLLLTRSELADPSDMEPSPWVEALFPAVRAMTLALRPEDELRILWPTTLPLQPLDWTVRRALRWRSAWTPQDPADAHLMPLA